MPIETDNGDRVGHELRQSRSQGRSQGETRLGRAKARPGQAIARQGRG